MWRFVATLLTLATGIAAGVLLMHGIDRGGAPPAAETPAARAADESVVPAPADRGVARAADSDAEVHEPPDTPSEVRTPSGLPDVYRGFVEQRERGLTREEMHAMFQAEGRDGPWADTMEASIDSYVASYAASHGLVVEYVECRSRFCEMAGYAIPGHEPDFGALWADMSGEPWWDASGRMSAQLDGEEAAQRRFIAILPRHDEDGLSGR